MKRQLFGRLKFLKSQWFLSSLLGAGLLGYIYWIAHLEKKDAREEVREWTVGLLFPAIVGGGGYWLNQQAERRSGKEKNEEREQSELKNYFDRISTLVVENGLTKCDEESEQYQIARALTANIFRQLTGERMNQVMFFLGSLSLLGRPIDAKEESPEGKNEQTKRSLSLLRGIDLSNAELQGLKGMRIDLSKAYLFKGNLSGANIERSNFSEANLSGANLSGAVLTESILYDVNLSGADLSGANLCRANLEVANLSEANLSGAILWNTELWFASLSGAKLEKTKLSKHLTEEQQKQCEIYDPIVVESEE